MFVMTTSWIYRRCMTMIISIEKVRGTSTYQLIVDGEVVAKGDKKKITRKANQYKRERGE